MAMTTCKECGGPLSTKAGACPKCGAKVKRTSIVTWLVAGVLGLGVIMGMFASCENSRDAAKKADAESARRSALTPEQRQAEDKRKADADAAKAKNAAASEAAFQRALLVAKAVKGEREGPVVGRVHRGA